MHNKDLNLTNIESIAESPLDYIGEEEVLKPDPEEVLPLLTSSESSQRMMATRVFCELQDQRAISPLIQLLKDDCPLIRVSAAYALGRNHRCYEWESPEVCKLLKIQK